MQPPSGHTVRRRSAAELTFLTHADEDDLARLTVPALKSALRSRRMHVSGLKADLVARLLSAKPPPTLAEIDALAREHSLKLLGLMH